MNRVLRIFLITLLLAGLPLRGYAAVMMAGEMLRHQMPVQQAVAQPAQEAHAAHDHESHMHGFEAGMDMQSHAMHMAAPHGDTPDTPDSAPHAANPCVTCGDCCTVGALQSLAPLLASHARVTRVAALSLPLPASFLADLPVPPPNP
jgi:hypothetical protein